MSATYGVLRSDMTNTTATKRGTDYVSATAQTFRTFATVTTWRDGRVHVEISRDDRTIFDAQLSGEDAETLAIDITRNDAERI